MVTDWRLSKDVPVIVTCSPSCAALGDTVRIIGKGLATTVTFLVTV